MPQERISLKEAVAVFQIHSRTMLRAISGERNCPWSEDDYETANVGLSEIAKAYGTSPKALRRVFEGRDQLKTQAQMCAELGVPDRTFRYRGYPSIRCGGIVRYFRSAVLNRHYAIWDTE